MNPATTCWYPLPPKPVRVVVTAMSGRCPECGDTGWLLDPAAWGEREVRPCPACAVGAAILARPVAAWFGPVGSGVEAAA